MIVRLSQAEIIAAANAGVMRQAMNIRSGLANAHGLTEGADWQVHIEGALGECAVAKALDLYWPGVGTFRASDVGRLQVRTTSLEPGCLILHKEDGDLSQFVLVVGRNGVYDLRGWILGEEGKIEVYWRPLGQGRSAYFVPQSALHDMVTLHVR